MIERIAERAYGKPWHQIRRVLYSLQITKLLTLNQRVHLRNEISAETRNIFKKLEINLSTQIIYLENRSQNSQNLLTHDEYHSVRQMCPSATGLREFVYLHDEAPHRERMGYLKDGNKNPRLIVHLLNHKSTQELKKTKITDEISDFTPIGNIAPYQLLRFQIWCNNMS